MIADADLAGSGCRSARRWGQSWRSRSWARSRCVTTTPKSPWGVPGSGDCSPHSSFTPGKVVSVERLIDAVWAGEEPPERAAKTLNTYLSRLRAALGDGLVQKRDPGYSLVVDPDMIDATRFEQLVAVAHARLEAGSATECKVRLDEALALWNGPAYDEFASEPWAWAAASRLEELRLSAREDRAEALRILGETAEAVGELERLTVEFPLRERSRHKLMLALYRDGRQADALRSFQSYRRHLAEEVGLEPSGELAELERMIATRDPRIDRGTARPASRGAPATRRSRGRAAATCRDRGTGCLCGARAATRSAAHRVEERGDGPRAAARAGCGRARDRQDAARGSGRRTRSPLRARGCCTGGVTTGWRSRTRPGCTRSAVSSRAPTTRRSLLWRRWRRISCGASRSSASGCPMSCRGRRRMQRRIERGCSTRSTRCSRRSPATSPLLLVLDDLHWADPATLGLLRWILSSERGGPMLVSGHLPRHRCRPPPSAERAARRPPARRRCRAGGAARTRGAGDRCAASRSRRS